MDLASTAQHSTAQHSTAHSTAFTLIELLIVIAIIGIIAAVAVPIYQTHVVRAVVLQDVSFGQNLMRDIVFSYQAEGSWPTSINVFGKTIVAGAHWQSIPANDQGLQGLNYKTNTRSASLDLMFNNLTGIPGFSAVGYNPSGAGYSSIAIVARDMGDGLIKTGCGQSPYSNQDIPLTYLPSTCSCPTVNNFYNSSNGTGC